MLAVVFMNIICVAHKILVIVNAEIYHNRTFEQCYVCNSCAIVVQYSENRIDA